ncbi:histamine transporter [Arctopsyche grandis]|uniref:histamine transporter n=1 Tax=Arctopsyche grandis TaxID=121162 RepID=UPI00406D656A
MASNSTYAMKNDFDATTPDTKPSTPDAIKAMGKAPEYKLYKRRWLVLFIFVLYSASNAMQWIQYAIIADVIMDYYNTSSIWVDWTSMIFMITYIPLIFPASWMLDKFGLRVSAILGSFGTMAGSWLKVFSVPRDMFWLGFLGQSVVGISQVFVLNLPARLAAVWFGPNQVSSACSIGVFGNQLGIAAGFLLPPMLVKNSGNYEQIGHDLSVMFYCLAGLTTVLFVLILLFFKAGPPTPPSAAQDIQNPIGDNFFKSIKRLATNRNYILLLLSYGMNVGCFYAISTLLNQVILQYYPGANEDAGRIGLVIVLAGMLGSVMCGIILDKTHRFKETAFGVYSASLIGMVIYTFTLSTGYIVIVYISSFLLGFFMTGYLAVGFEFAAEVTYPEPEGTTAGILNAAAQVFGIALTIMYGYFLKMWGDVWSNITLCMILVCGTIITATIKSDLRRQAAQGVA